MERNFLKINLLILLFGILLMSCDKHPYNFSHLTTVETSGSWGVPLAEVKYSISDILGKLDTIRNLQVGEDGGMRFLYESEFDNIIKASDYMHFAHVHHQETQDFNGVSLPSIPGITVQLPHNMPVRLMNDNVLVDYAVIKSGHLRFMVTHNLPGNFTIIFTCQEIRTPQGVPFAIQYDSVSGYSFQRDYDIAQYAISPGDSNTLNFNVEVRYTSGEAPLPETINFQYTVDVDTIVLRQMRGKIAPLSMNFDKSFALDFNASNFGGDFTLCDPTVTIYNINSFPFSGECLVNDVSFSGQGIDSSSLLTSTPTIVNIPISPIQYAQQEVPHISNIHFYTHYTSLNVDGKAVFNPLGFDAGTIFLTEDASISLKVSVMIPLRVNLNNVSYRDTFNMKQTNLPDINSIQDMLLRVDFVNDLPLEVSTQIYFYDSQTHSIVDSVLLVPQILQGAYADVPVQCPPIYIERESFDEIRRLLACDQYILVAKFNTYGIVTFNSKQYLKARLAVRFNVGDFALND